MNPWETISKLLELSRFLLNTITLVIGFILGLFGSLIIEIVRLGIERKKRGDTTKKLLRALAEEIENGIGRCHWLINALEKQIESYSRIYTGLFDSVKLVIVENIEDAEMLILLHKIYYRFDLINFNMNQGRFGNGAAFAKEYIKEIEENHVSLERKIQLL